MGPPYARESNEGQHPEPGAEQGQECGRELEGSDFIVGDVVRKGIVVLAAHVARSAAPVVWYAEEDKHEDEFEEIEATEGGVEAVHVLASAGGLHLCESKQKKSRQ